MLCETKYHNKCKQQSPFNRCSFSLLVKTTDKNHVAKKLLDASIYSIPIIW